MKNYIHCLLKVVPVWGSRHAILAKEALTGFRKQFQLLKFINHILQGINSANEFKEPFSLHRFYHTQSKGFFRLFASFICSHCWHGLIQVILARWNSQKHKTRRKVNFNIWREIQQIEKPLITIKSLWSMRLKN